MTHSETVTILLPLPPAILSPNRHVGSRGGRFAFAAATKKYRRIAKEAAEAQQATFGWERATVQLTFWHRQKRRRDDINHAGMMKPAYDGIVEAGLVVDDDSEHLTTLRTLFGIDKDHPRVEMVFTRVE
jgi:crossover junction endodeoxyribonuclease RusA